MKRMKNIIGKIITFLLIIILSTDMLSVISSHAGEKADKPGTPKIKVKLLENGTDVKITVGKTKGAEGYKIFMTTDIKYKDYGAESNYKEVATIVKNGTKKRSIILKNLPKGDLSIRVRAYITKQYVNNPQYTYLQYGEFSKEKAISICKSN